MPHAKASSDEPPHTEHIERYCNIVGLTLLPCFLLRRNWSEFPFLAGSIPRIILIVMIWAMEIVYKAHFLGHFIAPVEPGE